jgi:hypothetical protein
LYPTSGTSACRADCNLPGCLPIPCDINGVTLQDAAFVGSTDGFVYVSMHAYMCICICTCLCKRMCLCICTCLCLSMYMYKYCDLLSHGKTCLNAVSEALCMWSTCACIRAYIYLRDIYIYIYTHTHIEILCWHVHIHTFLRLTHTRTQSTMEVAMAAYVHTYMPIFICTNKHTLAGCHFICQVLELINQESCADSLYVYIHAHTYIHMYTDTQRHMRTHTHTHALFAGCHFGGEVQARIQNQPRKLRRQLQPNVWPQWPHHQHRANLHLQCTQDLQYKASDREQCERTRHDRRNDLLCSFA